MPQNEENNVREVDIGWPPSVHDRYHTHFTAQRITEMFNELSRTSPSANSGDGSYRWSVTSSATPDDPLHEVISPRADEPFPGESVNDPIWDGPEEEFYDDDEDDEPETAPSAYGSTILDISVNRGRIINRIVNAGRANEFSRMSGVEQLSLLEEYAYPEYEEYDNARQTTAKGTDKVYTFDDPERKKPLALDLVTFISGIGYVRKDDVRLKPDAILEGQYILDEPSYMSIYYKYYDGIDSDGKLTFKGYTFGRNKAIDSYPKVYTGVDTNVGYAASHLLKNPIFNYRYKEDLSSGIFYSRDITMPKVKMSKVCYRKRKCAVGEFAESIKNKPQTYISTMGKKYKFGLEIETASGYMPEYLDKELFYSAVHDGSLRDPDTDELYGGEYVTDVLWGDQGLKQLKSLCYELTRRCSINKRCGVHVHLSGVNFSKENIVLMYP